MPIQVDRDLEFIPAMKKIMDKLKDLEDKIGLVKSDTATTVTTADKILKKVK